MKEIQSGGWNEPPSLYASFNYLNHLFYHNKTIICNQSSVALYTKLLRSHHGQKSREGFFPGQTFQWWAYNKVVRKVLHFNDYVNNILTDRSSLFSSSIINCIVHRTTTTFLIVITTTYGEKERKSFLIQCNQGTSKFRLSKSQAI